MKFRRKTYKLGEIIDLYDNLRIPLSSMEREGREKKYPYYGANGIIDYVDDYIFDGEYILLAEDGTVFIEDKYPVLHLTQGKFWVNNHAHVFKSKNEIANQNFLYYILKNTNIRAYVTGAVQLKINQRNLKKIKVTIPNLEVQKAIANILSSFDDKIEVNNKINKNLEELAQTLYKHWFVDFEFPDENGNPYKSSGGKMIESELGLIPEGWEVKEVIDLFNFVGGSQPPKKEHIYENKEGYVRFIQNRDYSGNDNHITYIKESPRNKLCDETDIMMDKYGEAGKVRFGISGAYNVALAKIDSKDVDKEYLRRYFEQSSIENYILNASQASTRPSVNQTVFTNLKVAYPPTKLLNKFNEISRNIIIKTLLYRSENKKLAEMRDLLLPKLMSGEIRLPIEE
jgi:type I restriction enzyme S subunit